MPTEKPTDQNDPSPGNGERASGNAGGLKQRLANRFKRRPEEHDKKVGTGEEREREGGNCCGRCSHRLVGSANLGGRLARGVANQ